MAPMEEIPVVWGCYPELADVAALVEDLDHRGVLMPKGVSQSLAQQADVVPSLVL